MNWKWVIICLVSNVITAWAVLHPAVLQEWKATALAKWEEKFKDY